jgi:lysozyme family protein
VVAAPIDISSEDNIMTAANFDAALARVLAHEGGYSNHPADPGGPTNFGITLETYRRYVKADAGAADIRAMSMQQAAAIYRARYWDALRCDELSAGLDYCLFDYGVNSGVGRAAKVLQRLVGLPDDARMSDATIAAVRACEAQVLIRAICAERLAFLKSLKTWPVFGKGWSRRVAEVESAALAMARSAPAGAPAQAPRAPLAALFSLIVSIWRKLV